MTKTCKHCGDVGIVLIYFPDTEDYDALACICPQGQWWRQPRQLRAWAAMQKPKPVRIGRLENYYDVTTFRATREDGDVIAKYLDKQARTGTLVKA